MIIDIHTHAFPDALAQRAVTTLAARAGVPAYTDGTCASLVAAMRRAGVDRAVVAPIATKPTQARTITEWAIAVNRQYPELICFGSIHPAQEDWAAEIDRLVAAGIAGVKFHHDYQQTFVDAPALLPIYRALADVGLIVLFHAGVDIGLPPPVHCPPERLARVLDAVPSLIAIGSHMGGYAQWEEVERCLVGRELYLDTSYSLTALGMERMTALITAHGAERILFGTDSPWTEHAAELANIRALPLAPAAIDAILGGNAKRLLFPATSRNL